jgi:hypothetical protein
MWPPTQTLPGAEHGGQVPSQEEADLGTIYVRQQGGDCLESHHGDTREVSHSVQGTRTGQREMAVFRVRNHLLPELERKECTGYVARR